MTETKNFDDISTILLVNETERMGTIRVPLYYDTEESGTIYSELTRYVIDLVVRFNNSKPAEVEFFPAFGYDYDPTATRDTANLSVLTQLHLGMADLTPPYMPMTTDRMLQFDHIGSLGTTYSAFIYKKRPRLPPTVDLLGLISWNVYAFFILLQICFELLLRTFKAYPASKIIGKGSWVICSLLGAVLWKYLAGSMIMFFKDYNPNANVFKNTQEVMSAINRSAYRPLMMRQASAMWSFEGLMNSTYTKSLPYVLANDSTEMARMILDTEYPDTPLVTYVFSEDIDKIVRRYCGLSILSDDMTSIGVAYTIFLAPKPRNFTILDITGAQKKLIEIYYSRLRRSLQKNDVLSCNVEESKKMKASELRIGQIIQVFYMFFIVLGACCVCCVLEWLSGQFLSKSQIERPKSTFKNLFKESIQTETELKVKKMKVISMVCANCGIKQFRKSSL